MSRIKLPIEPRFLRIPATWTRKTAFIHEANGVKTEDVFVPAVHRNAKADLIDDPWKLRSEFLRMERTEDAALRFLSKVGVWEAVTANPQSDLKETALAGVFGVRWFVGHARPITLELLWAEQKHWKELLDPRNHRKLRAKFTPPRAEARESVKAEFSSENTLPVHMEWKPGERQFPYAFVQPITGRELLIATTWIDIVRREKFQVCDRCGCPFTGKKRPYCTDFCAHAAAQKRYRKRGGEKRLRARNREKKKRQKSLR
jgi:hypothetical protein